MKTLLTLTFIFLFNSISDRYCPEVVLLNSNDFKIEIEKNSVQLVDIRTLEEYQAGHIKGALNADIIQGQLFKKKFEELDKDKPVFIYCRSGSRTKVAARFLCQMGFKKVYELRGGYLTWQ